MGTIWTIIVLVAGILNLILFFKIWGMCNNVKTIKDLYVSEVQKSTVTKKNKSNEPIKIGDNVIILKNGKMSMVTSINGDKFECASNNGNFFDGIYSANELEKA